MSFITYGEFPGNDSTVSDSKSKNNIQTLGTNLNIHSQTFLYHHWSSLMKINMLTKNKTEFILKSLDLLQSSVGSSTSIFG